MDLGTIRDRLEALAYGADWRAFAADMRLVFDNAMAYNRPGSDIFFMAESVKAQFNFKMAKLLESSGLPPEEGSEGVGSLKPARNVSRVPKVGNSGPKIVGKAPRSRPGLEFKPGRGAYTVSPEAGKKSPGGPKSPGGKKSVGGAKKGGSKARRGPKRAKRGSVKRVRGGKRAESESESESGSESENESEGESESDSGESEEERSGFTTEESDSEGEDERVRCAPDVICAASNGFPTPDKRRSLGPLTLARLRGRAAPRTFDRKQRAQLALELRDIMAVPAAMKGMLAILANFIPDISDKKPSQVELNVMIMHDDLLALLWDYATAFRARTRGQQPDAGLFARWAASDDIELESASESDASGGWGGAPDGSVSPDIEGWDVDEFETKPPAAAAAPALASDEPLQINMAVRPPPLQILDPKTLALTGPKSPFLGHRHSQENENWMGYELQSPSEMGDEDIGGPETAAAQTPGEDPNAGLEFLNLNAGVSHDCVAQ